MHTIAELRKETKVPVVIVNQGGTVTAVNAAFEALFGWARQEIVGRPLTTIMPESLREIHQRGFSRFLATGIQTLLNRPITLKAVTKDGRIFNAVHTITAQQDGSEWVFGATIEEDKPLR